MNILGWREHRQIGFGLLRYQFRFIVILQLCNSRTDQIVETTGKVLFRGPALR
jgi:hypothetical protein